MDRKKMVGLARLAINGSGTVWDVADALHAALTELKVVGDALGTVETGEALVAVARDAHKAEQEHAADEELVGRLRAALGVHATCTVFCGGCGVRYQECQICDAVVAARGDGFEPVECDGHEVEGHRAGCLLEG